MSVVYSQHTVGYRLIVAIQAFEARSKGKIKPLCRAYRGGRTTWYILLFVDRKEFLDKYIDGGFTYDLVICRS